MPGLSMVSPELGVTGIRPRIPAGAPSLPTTRGTSSKSPAGNLTRIWQKGRDIELRNWNNLANIGNFRILRCRQLSNLENDPGSEEPKRDFRREGQDSRVRCKSSR